MTRMRPLPAVLAAVVLLAGCGGNTDQPATRSTPAATTPSPSPSPTPAGKDEYDGAQRLAGGLNEAGIACLNWERTENPIGAEERGSCYVGEEEIVASIYATAGEAAAAPEEHAALLAGISDTVMVVGGNWTLSCDSTSLCGQIEKKFGGRLVVIPA
jgi:hypothetical protein